MRERLRFAAAVLAAAFLLLGVARVVSPAHPVVARAAAPPEADTDRTLTVTGSASLDQKPDTAEVRLSVRTEAPLAKDATSTNQRLLAAVIDRLRGLGIKDQDMRTAAWNLMPQYEYQEKPSPNPPRVIGYQVQATLAVRTAGVDHVGDLIDAAVAGGANGVESVSYFVQDAGAVEDQLLLQAVKAARAKADLMAQQLGVRIVGVRRASIEGPVLYGGAPEIPAPARQVFLPPGTNQVTRTVQVEFLISN